MHGPLRGDAVLGALAGPGAVADPEVAAKRVIPDLGGREKAVLVPLVILIFGIGFYPQPLLDVITPSVKATMSSVGLTDPVEGN